MHYWSTNPTGGRCSWEDVVRRSSGARTGLPARGLVILPCHFFRVVTALAPV